MGSRAGGGVPPPAHASLRECCIHTSSKGDLAQLSQHRLLGYQRAQTVGDGNDKDYPVGLGGDGVGGSNKLNIKYKDTE
jgi:hypothetical protein